MLVNLSNQSHLKWSPDKNEKTMANFRFVVTHSLPEIDVSINVCDLEYKAEEFCNSILEIYEREINYLELDVVFHIMCNDHGLNYHLVKRLQKLGFQSCYSVFNKIFDFDSVESNSGNFIQFSFY